MSDQHQLMRPLRSDSLKPRPVPQAVWTPAPETAVLNPPAKEADPVYEAPAIVEERPELPVWEQQPVENAVETQPAPACEAPAREAEIEIGLPDGYAQTQPQEEHDCRDELTANIASLLALEGDVQQEEVSPLQLEEMDWLSDDAPVVGEDAQEEAHPETAEDSLKDTIAALLSDADDDEADDDEDRSVLHDAVPDRFIPEPACVPLYDSPAPRRNKRRFWWVAALAVLAAGVYAAWRLGVVPVNLP